MLIRQIYGDGKAGLHGEEIEGLYAAAMDIRPARLLEVGSRGGTSSITLGLVAKETDGRLWCVEPRFLPRWQGNMEKYQIADRVTQVKRWSPWLFGDAPEIELPLDFVFIDGGHGVQQVVTDFLFWFPQVRQGGRVAMHDWWMPSVHSAMTIVRWLVGKSVNPVKRVGGNIPVPIGKRCGIMVFEVAGCRWAPPPTLMKGE